MGQFCNRDSVPIVTILPYKFKNSKRLNGQKKRRNFYVFLCTIHEQKSGVRPPEPFGSGLWDSVLEKSAVLFQQDRQCSFGFFILRRNICLPHIQKWKAPHNVSPSSEIRLLQPESFLLSTLFFPPVFVVFASWHDVYYHTISSIASHIGEIYCTNITAVFCVLYFFSTSHSPLESGAVWKE